MFFWEGIGNNVRSGSSWKKRIIGIDGNEGVNLNLLIMENYENEKYQKAKKKIEEIKGFYIHLAVYLIVNLFISINNIIGNLGGSKMFWEAFWDFGNFALWIFWGIGLVFHGTYTFDYNPFFSKQWEERKIRKFMEEDKREFEKYR